MKLEILGSINGQQYYNEQQICALLEEQQTELSYGKAFMGRPGTSLYAGTNAIIKMRNDLDLNELRARHFLQHALEQEQKLGVHHPHKTWFLIQQADGKFKIGNICPRLTPVHTLPDQNAQDIATKFVYLEMLYQRYFRAASCFSARLDEGLSNFGIDNHQQLYYLDDDIYTWDNFVSFAHILGVLIRNNAWLNEDYAVILGAQLHRLINEFFEDSHTAIMVARKLRDVFIPDKTRRQVLLIIIEQLQENKTIAKKIQPYQQDRIAILSDIHANLPALDAVLAYLATENITQGIVLGDTVGYGPHPSECIERLQHTSLQVLKGNHDHSVATGDTKRGMSTTARKCVEWTIPRLSQAQRQWLNDLPLEFDSADGAVKRWQAIHGAPIDPNYFYAYVYQMTYEENLDILAERHVDFCFHGHSHIQGMYVRDKQGVDSFIRPQANLSLESFSHALVCPGAVGQPRDGGIGAQFAIYNQNSQQIEFILIDYDMDKTIADIKAFELPDTLWQRLMRGN